MKKLYILILIVFISLLTGCGGGGGGASFSSTAQTIPMCTTGTYTILKSGDTVVNDTAGTTVKILHNTDGTKSICVETGSAHIE